MRCLSPKQRMWKEIAEAFETRLVEKNARQVKLTQFGLCWSVYYYSGYNRGSNIALYLSLKEAGWMAGAYLDPPPDHPKASITRAGLAALFAAMTDAERKRTFGYAI